MGAMSLVSSSGGWDSTSGLPGTSGSGKLSSPLSSAPLCQVVTGGTESRVEAETSACLMKETRRGLIVSRSWDV